EIRLADLRHDQRVLHARRQNKAPQPRIVQTFGSLGQTALRNRLGRLVGNRGGTPVGDDGRRAIGTLSALVSASGVFDTAVSAELSQRPRMLTISFGDSEASRTGAGSLRT